MWCPKCKTENAEFGRNRARPDGRSAYCKKCMRESRKNANNKPIDWKAVNERRRGNPVYRDRERKRANELDKQRRINDKAYGKYRYEGEKKRTQGPRKAEIAKTRNRQKKERIVRKVVQVISELKTKVDDLERPYIKSRAIIKAMEDKKAELEHMEDRRMSNVLHDLNQIDRSLKHYFQGVIPLQIRQPLEALDYACRLHLEEQKAKVTKDV